LNRLYIVGTYESYTSSYYGSVLRINSFVLHPTQSNGPFYVESFIEYISDVNISDIQIEISKLSNDILILQNDTGNHERILRFEDKTNNITRNGVITKISNALNVDHITGLKAEDIMYQKIISIVLEGDNGINLNSGMAANQGSIDSDILLAGDNPELHSPYNDFVKRSNSQKHIMILIEEIQLF
jgi:hypothetical protein